MAVAELTRLQSLMANQGDKRFIARGVVAAEQYGLLGTKLDV